MSGYRPPYTVAEEKKIVDYIVKDKAHYRTRSDSLWKEMEEAAIIDRTWQSMKQHFKKKIVYQLHYPVYELESYDIHTLKKAFHETYSGLRKPRKTKKKSAESTKADTDSSESETKTPPDPVDFFTMKFSDDET